jgi:hypothetical protein
MSGALLLGAYVLRNKTVLTNIVTYLPTANITFVNSTSFINVANVTGFADARIDAVKTGEVVCGNTTAYFPGYNSTGYIISIYSVDNINYDITMGYETNGSKTVTDRYTGSMSFTARACNGCTDAVASFEGGSYAEYKPLAKVVIKATSYVASVEDKNISDTPYRYIYYDTPFNVARYTRSLRLYRADVTINAEQGKIFTGVLSTMKLIVNNNKTIIELPTNISKLITNTISAYP